MKKIISLVLSLIMVLSVASIGLTAFADDGKSGYCGADGDNLAWSLNDGVLTISGTGDMENFSDDGNLADRMVPWHNVYAPDETIKEVVIEPGVTSIGGEAFYELKALEKVTIPDTVTKIGWWAFYRCSKLTDITIPENVTFIGERAFSLTGVSEMNLPKIVKISDYAFESSALEKITLGDNVEEIGISAFLNSKYYKNENNWEDGALYIGNAFIAFNDTDAKSYSVKEGTRIIGKWAFQKYRMALEEITLPSSLEVLPMSTFDTLLFKYKDSGKYDIFIPENVKKVVNDYHFGNYINSIKVSAKNTVYDSRNNCNAIIETKKNRMIIACNKTTIPNTVKTIGSNAFYGINEKEYLYIPKSVVRVEAYAFGLMSKLRAVYYAGSSNDWKKIRITYQKGEKESYKYADSDYSTNDVLYYTLRYYNCTPIKVKQLTKGKKSFTVKYNKLGSANGYQIKYSTDKNFKNDVHYVSVKGNKTFKRTIKGLKSNKKYYVRVRGWRVEKRNNINKGKNIYSNWSTVKTVTTK